MAQIESTAQMDPGLMGLDPSLVVPANTDELVRRWIPKGLTIGALILGGALAYGLPALNLSDGSSLSLNEVTRRSRSPPPAVAGYFP
jgi:hypothetical protein